MSFRRALLTCALLYACAGQAGASSLMGTIPASHDAFGGMEAVVSMPQEGYPLALETFELRADRLRVVVGKAQTDSVALVEIVHSQSNVTYDLQDVQITLAGTRETGHVGIHPGKVRDASITPYEDAQVFAYDWSYIYPYAGWMDEEKIDKEGLYRTGWWPLLYPRSDDGREYYYRSVAYPNLVVESPGVFRYAGSGEIHVHGVHLLIESKENTTLLETGKFRGPGEFRTTGETVWAILKAENLTLVSASRDPWKVAFSELHLLDAVVSPEGVRRAAIAPAPGTTEPSVHAQIPVIPILGMVSIVTIGAGWMLIPRFNRRRPDGASAALDPRESWEPEDCMSRASVHIEAARFDRALEWVTQARRLAPTSARVRGTEAFVLGQLGRIDEALAAYAEASRLAPAEGEHDFLAGRLALRASRSAEEVEALLVRALERSPDLAPEFDEDEALQAVASRPRLAVALDLAWDAYGASLGRGSPGDE